MSPSERRFPTSARVWLRTEESGVVRADLVTRIWTGRCDRVSMRLSRDHVVLVQLSDDIGPSGARSHVVARAATADRAARLMAQLLTEIESALHGQFGGCIEVHPDRGPELKSLLRPPAAALAGA
ncbi:hypothetical protein Lesp02_22840 [Lentzea sp. NBRC 105346]|uniref:hypothetical protein n=1 Tax=Lentzea sp. NBRC 105346 TaxID=3032205 RepID=UPI0024A5C76D|nr:hypothetical protein [Lentzea sp. NBRC 105346]GLZ30094.1 hypothetical protein Lesp02_22840 [Lentzea sp. NBRC 105346]